MLSKYSLILRSDDSFQIHRIVQWILRETVDRKSMPNWVDMIRENLCAFAPDETAEDPRTWRDWDQIRPHAEELVKLARENDDVKPHLNLMVALGVLYYGKGLYQLSLPLEREALQVAEATQGAESTQVANCLLSLGESLRVLDRSGEALEMFEKSMEIRHKIDGKDSPRIADILNYIALTKEKLSQIPEAKECYKNALKIYEAQGDDVNISSYIKLLENLATSQGADGNAEEANRYLQKGVALSEGKKREQVRPQLAIISVLKLASLLDGNQQKDDIERLLRSSFERTLVFAESHYLREVSVETLSLWIRKNGRLTEARNTLSMLKSRRSASIAGRDVKEEALLNTRSKLRICQAIIELDKDGYPVPHQVLDAEEPWLPPQPSFTGNDPPSFRALTIADSSTATMTWAVDAVSADVTQAQLRQFTRILTQYFLCAIAVDEIDQWADADGSMPSNLRYTVLRGALQDQARELEKLAFALLEEQGKSQREPSEGSMRKQLARRPEFLLEFWLVPGESSVYTGGLDGELEGQYASGEPRAIILSSKLDTFCELRRISGAEVIEAAEFWNQSASNWLLEQVNKAVKEGGAFGRLRQVFRSMVLAIWFKEEYRSHENYFKFLESGNADQLSPSITDAGDDDEGEKVLLRNNLDRAVMKHGAFSVEAAFAMNQLSIALRRDGRIEPALILAKEALRVDQAHRDPDAPELPHRMCNLAVLLTMSSELSDACDMLASAWERRIEDRDITAVRILIVRRFVASIRSEPLGTYMGRIRDLLE